MRMPIESAYRDDLARIHDAGFGHFARSAARVLIDELSDAQRLVVDLGCGSGILAEALGAAGHRVLGFDLSESMLKLARRRAATAEFRRESFVRARLPRCDAVCAIGEVFCYLFDSRNRAQRLPVVLKRIYRALLPGGILLFDIAQPGRGGPVAARRRFFEGDGWTCLVEIDEDRHQSLLTRRIVTFRQTGEMFRRDEETHRLRLYDASAIRQQLREAGFQARALSGYADFHFPKGLTGFLARKPK